MRKWPILIGVSALSIAGGAAWLFHSQPNVKETVVAVKPIPAVINNVQVSDMPIVKAGLGTVVAYNVVNIHAQVTGTIQKIGFVEGQTVRPGSLIAQLDPRPFQAALEQAQANLQRDQAHLANAQTNLTRYQQLFQKNSIAEIQVTNQSAAVQELLADVANDKAAIYNDQTQLSYTTITSPIDGVTGIKRVDVGNLIQPTNTVPIVTVTQLQPISVIFTLPQTDLPEIQTAMGKSPLKTIAYPQDGSRPLGEGTLLLVNNEISQTSGTIELKATFPNQNRALWPGEFVEVRLVVSVRKNAISVPLSALQQGASGQVVFVVDADDRVRLEPVTVRETLDGRALIDSGLKPGDALVVAGQYRLQNGVQIVPVPADDPRVQNETTASQGML
jgi:membrane fusion protein, multidrug efflux system